MRTRGAVVVTGASSGIGWATALVLAHEGWWVFAGIRQGSDGEALLAAAAAIGAGALLQPIRLDVTNEASIAAAAEIAAKLNVRGDRLVGLVNNAGIAVAGPIEEIPLTRLRAVLEVNVVGAVATTQALLPLLRAGRGRIVNVSSVSGRVASPFLGPYAASKFALEALSDALRVELAPWGLKVVLVEPGPVATPIWGKGEAMADEDSAAVGDSSPYAPYLGRVRAAFRDGAQRGIPPEIVAGVIVRALSVPRPRARYLVGSNRAAVALVTRLAPDGVRDWLIARRR
jgi:NAD(P)-dependent dehydrogenase (short-subunit alcohol dehydrogenase family)